MSKILVVDDSALSRKISKRSLESAGFEVVTANDGKEGLEAIESMRPACVVLDLLMPVMTGFEVLEALQQKGDPTPVFVVSADIQETTRSRVLELGARALLNKPVQAETLAQAVRGVLNEADQEAA